MHQFVSMNQPQAEHWTLHIFRLQATSTLSATIEVLEPHSLGANMSATLKAALIAATCLFFSIAAGADETSETGTASAPGALEKTGKAIEHGAKATASGIERGTKAAVKGVKRGANAAASGIERGAQATGKAARKVVKKMGLSNTADSETQDAKP